LARGVAQLLQIRRSFCCPPADSDAPELIGCLLVKWEAGGGLLWGVIVETEAYRQGEPACHGYRLPWRWYLRASRSVSRRARGGSPAQGFDLPGFGVARFPQPLP
jgi:3-methyladenine DNA glycosylase Mpg